MRRATALLASLALLFTLFPAAALAAPSASSTWIVTLRAGADPAASARSLLRAHGGEVRYVYTDALRGFAFRGPQAAADAIQRSPLVARVEPDAEVRLDTTQSDATWGLDRIDQRTPPLDQNYTYAATGAGVTAYVIDSGILTGHAEFEGRASIGLDLVDANDEEDCNGHGTHVAGTIGGKTYGVAKEVKLIAVRVFDCTGGSAWSTIIEGIDWVIGHHGSEPAVANMSLSGGGNQSVDDATERLIADGVSTTVAAGNGNFVGRQADACNYSPARVPAAMTISATNSSDKKASWANYGDCVDWFAPGVSITSAWYTSTTATNTISGTSMATPHTAGVAALYLERNPSHSPAQVRNAILAETTKGIVTSSSTANNHLLFSGFIGTGGDQPSAGTYSVSFAGSSTSQGSTWTAVVTVSATGPEGALDGVAVTGTWDVAAGSATCTTGQAPSGGSAVTGQCQIVLSGLRKKVSSVTFTADSVVGAGGTWTVPEPVTIGKP